MVKWGGRKLGDLLWLVNGLILAIVVNQLASLYFFRVDMTEEERYTIKKPTRELLKSLTDDVYVEVYLEGDLNAGFRRLNKAIRETLQEFQVYSHNKVHFTFINPAKAIGKNAQNEFMSALSEKGIQPMNVIDTQDGKRTEKLVFPGALISYSGEEVGVMLLRDKAGLRKEEVLNQSIEGIEYELANAINTLSNENRKSIGFLQGHGELDNLRTASLKQTLAQIYNVGDADMNASQALKSFDVLILAKPVRHFSEHDKYQLDQFVMGGGMLLVLMDRLEANMDSITRDDYFAFPYNLGLDDLLFRYGVRVNQDLVQDRFSIQYPIVTGNLNGKPQITPIEWPFFPLVNHYADHVITRNLDASVLKFVSSIDSVKATGIRKTPLLFTSAYSRKISTPVKINANDLRKEVKPENFSGGPIALAYLLEGKFTSLYKNRFQPQGVDSTGFKAEGVSKVIVVADGDVARNDINNRTRQPQRLGVDPFSGYTFANQELLVNMVAYLANDSGLISARNNVVKVRPLDKEKIRTNRWMIQSVNLVLPVVLLILLGVAKAYMRKRKYGNFKV